jgi:hypothetical protein
MKISFPDQRIRKKNPRRAILRRGGLACHPSADRRGWRDYFSFVTLFLRFAIG